MKMCRQFAVFVLIIGLIAPGLVLGGWSDKDRGFLVITSGPDGWCTENFFQSVRNMKSIGANVISLRIAMTQNTLYDNDFYAYWRTPSDDALRCGIDYVRSQGLDFGINLVINLLPGQGWRANMVPSDRNAWFRNMGDFAIKYARDFAGPYGASYFSVGTEMYKLVSNDHNSNNAAAPGRYRWPQIISDIRSFYDGPVTYSAQHSGNRSAVFDDNDLIPNLDYLGFSGYWPMEASNKAQALAEWNRVERETLLPAFNRYGIPLSFAELGYRPCSFTFLRPYDDDTPCNYNGNIQAVAWDALLTNFADKTYFNGMMGGWYWSDDPNAGGAGDTDYIPWGKPAVDVFISHWGDGSGGGSGGGGSGGGGSGGGGSGGGSCNLLSNGSLDTDTSDWLSNTTPQIVSDAVSGGGAMSVSAGWASTRVDADENTAYSISGYAKSTDGSGWSSLGVDFLDSNGVEIGEVATLVNASSSYNAFTLTDTSPPGTRYARLWVYASNDRTLQLDELDIHQTDCVGSACNLLGNGTFESGTGGWLANTALNVTQDASEGQQALRFSNGTISVRVPAVSGENFDLSGSYKSTSGSNWSGYGIDFLDASGRELSESVRTLPASSTYGSFDMSGSVPAGASIMQLWIKTPRGRTLTLDDLKLRNGSCQ